MCNYLVLGTVGTSDINREAKLFADPTTDYQRKMYLSESKNHFSPHPDPPLIP